MATPMTLNGPKEQTKRFGNNSPAHPQSLIECMKRNLAIGALE